MRLEEGLFDFAVLRKTNKRVRVRIKKGVLVFQHRPAEGNKSGRGRREGLVG